MGAPIRGTSSDEKSGELPLRFSQVQADSAFVVTATNGDVFSEVERAWVSVWRDTDLRSQLIDIYGAACVARWL